MAITDTIATIKDYFLNWHKENYEILHPKTTQVTNQKPNSDLNVTSGAVYDYVNDKMNDVTTCNVKMCNNTQTTLQTTLDQFDDTLKNKVNKDQYANANIIALYGGDGDNNTGMYCSNTQDGLIRWQEKLLLHEMATWHTIKTGLPPKTSMEINVALGLVHMHLYYPSCAKFKNNTIWTYESDGGNALQQFLPYGHVTVPLGSPVGGYLTIDNTGGFTVRVPSKKSSYNIVGDVLYKYHVGNAISEDNFDWGTSKRSMYTSITKVG